MSRSVLSKAFWLDAKERLVRTFIQTLIATLPVQTVSAELFEGDWAALQTLALQGVAAAGAASLSLLWSLLAAKKPGTISPASSVALPDDTPDPPGDRDDPGGSEAEPEPEPEFNPEYDPDDIVEDQILHPEVDDTALPDEHTAAPEER